MRFIAEIEIDIGRTKPEEVSNWIARRMRNELAKGEFSPAALMIRGLSVRPAPEIDTPLPAAFTGRKPYTGRVQP